MPTPSFPLFAAALLALLTMLAPGRLQAQEQKDSDPTRFAQEIAAFEQWDQKNTPPDHPILFVGSSSIRNWPTSASFPRYKVVNRGFGGSHISDVNHYLEETVLKYRPETIVFYAGDNDIAAGKTPQQVLDDYRTFANRVQEELPGTSILYLPIKPSTSRWELWPEMEEANELIRRYTADNTLLYYVDTATPMLADSNRPDPSLFLEDGLHMNEQGYALWNRVLRPYLEEVQTTPAN